MELIIASEWKKAGIFKILTDKHTRKRPLGRPRRRWENNIRMDLKEIGINTKNLVVSALDRDYLRALVNAALKLSGSISYGVSYMVLSDDAHGVVVKMCSH